MARQNEIHAMICVQYYGSAGEYGRGGRRKYQWRKYDCLRDMEVGDKIDRYVDAREWGIYRSMASRYKKEFGVRFVLHHRNGLLTITRTV